MEDPIMKSDFTALHCERTVKEQQLKYFTSYYERAFS